MGFSARIDSIFNRTELTSQSAVSFSHVMKTYTAQPDFLSDFDAERPCRCLGEVVYIIIACFAKRLGGALNVPLLSCDPRCFVWRLLDQQVDDLDHHRERRAVSVSSVTRRYLRFGQVRRKLIIQFIVIRFLLVVV